MKKQIRKLLDEFGKMQGFDNDGSYVPISKVRDIAQFIYSKAFEDGREQSQAEAEGLDACLTSIELASGFMRGEYPTPREIIEKIRKDTAKRIFEELEKLKPTKDYHLLSYFDYVGYKKLKTKWLGGLDKKEGQL